MSNDKLMENEDVIHIYLVIIGNKTRSFTVMGMDLESLIQSEVSQKEKKQILYINANIWNLEK